MKWIYRSLLVFLPLILSFPKLHAQYINADSLIQLPGAAIPLSVKEFNILLDDLQPDDLDAGQELFYGQYVPVGNILRHFVLPSDGKVISRYGIRSGRMHTGTDIKMPKGDTIFAVFQGKVIRASHYYGYGNMVVIDHGNSIETGYAHMSGFLVKAGDRVERNQPIGLAGSTGRSTTNHLHFEIKESGKFFDPELVYDFTDLKIKEEAYAVNSLAELKSDKRQVEISKTGEVPRNYIVSSGDSLWKISRKFRTSVKSLCLLNNLDEKTVLNVGMELKLF